MKSRIGFFGGCFNPITKAHIQLIKKVIQERNLDKVYFVPMGNLYEKKDLIKLEYRIEMLKLAFEQEEKMQILAISNQNEKTYAIDTFRIIDEKFPEAERFFIMGSDNFQKITQWKKSDALLKNYQYIVLNRENGDMKQISSSLVRQKIKQNEPIDDCVPAQVVDYIKQKNLYK